MSCVHIIAISKKRNRFCLSPAGGEPPFGFLFKNIIVINTVIYKLRGSRSATA
jgi:hypothetical protein